MDCDKTEYSYVGKRTPRIDALAKAQGIAKYTADYKTENMLIGKALYSKFPHARIINIDVSKAKALPGVEIVITAQDLDGEKTYGVFAADKPVLAEDKVRYVGDPVAFIAAPLHRGMGVVAASPQFRLLLNLKFYHIKLVDKDFFTAS